MVGIWGTPPMQGAVGHACGGCISVSSMELAPDPSSVRPKSKDWGAHGVQGKAPSTNTLPVVGYEQLPACLEQAVFGSVGFLSTKFFPVEGCPALHSLASPQGAKSPGS